MERNRRTILRAVGVLAALLIAAGAISPAMSAAPLTKAKVKKIAKKVAKQRINALVPGIVGSLAVSKSNYAIFNESLSFGQERTLATDGPLSLVVKCRQEAGDDIVELIARSTSSDWWTDDTNHYTAPGEAVLHYRSETSGTPSYGDGSDEQSAAALSGGQVYYIGVDDYKMGIGLNILGRNCLMAGSAVVA